MDVLDRTRVDTKVRSAGSRQTERLNLVGDGRSKEKAGIGIGSVDPSRAITSSTPNM